MKTDSIQYQPLSKAYLDGLTALDRLCFAKPWSRQAFADELINPVAAYVVAVCGGEVVGYAGVWIVKGEGQITNVAVHPDYRRRGVGRELVGRLIEACGDVDSVTLEVRKSNTAARLLYAEMGFEACGERKKYYEGVEDALIMTRRQNENSCNRNLL